MDAGNATYTRIYAVVRRIPSGRVATYGQVARLAGLPGHARLVGYALHSLGSASTLPWHRVINARGEVSPRALAGWEQVQRALLEDEGVRFDAHGRVDLRRSRWLPRPGRRAAGAGRLGSARTRTTPCPTASSCD